MQLISKIYKNTEIAQIMGLNGVPNTIEDWDEHGESETMEHEVADGNLSGNPMSSHISSVPYLTALSIYKKGSARALFGIL